MLFVGAALYRMLLFARQEERRRKAEGEPQTLSDSLLLLASGILVVTIVVAAIAYAIDHEMPDWFSKIITASSIGLAVGIYTVHRWYRTRRGKRLHKQS